LAFLYAERDIPESVKPEFGEFCAMVKHWWENIFPYFTWHHTNSGTETANGIIKIANRAGYAFEQIIAKALAHEPISAKFRFICENCLLELDPTEERCSAMA
jgi:transposase